MAKRPNLLTITNEDVGDHVRVVVKLTPKTTQDEVAAAQIAAALRQPGANGKPLMSDEDINRTVFKRPHPERIAERVELDIVEANNPDIQQLKQAAYTALWRKEHKDIVKLAENPDGEETVTMTKSKLQELVTTLAEAKHAEMMGVPVDAMMQQAVMQQQMAAVQQGQADPAAAPPGVGGGLAQAALPEQFAMMPADMIPEPQKTQAKQTRRGKPQNKPGRAGRQY